MRLRGCLEEGIKRRWLGFYMRIMSRMCLCGNNGWWKAKNEHGLGHPKVKVASAVLCLRNLDKSHIWTRLLPSVFLQAVATDGRVQSLCLRIVQSVLNLTTEQCPFPLIL